MKPSAQDLDVTATGEYPLVPVIPVNQTPIQDAVKEYYHLDGVIGEFCRSVIKKSLAAGIIQEDRWVDNVISYGPTRRDFKFESFDLTSKGLQITCDVYCGSGEYDYNGVLVPTEYLDRVDVWIENRKAEIAKAVADEALAAAAKAVQDKLAAEAAELARYLELKKKYEAPE